MTSERRAQKIHSDDVSLPSSGVELLIDRAAGEACFKQSEAQPTSG